MSERLLDTLFLLAVGTVTWAALRFAAGPVDVTWSDILISAFLAVFILDRFMRRDSSIPPAAATLACFMLVFLTVYLWGYFGLQSQGALAYWTKGVTAWLAHALFLVLGTAYVIRRGAGLYARTVRWFLGGIVICAAYGVVQLAVKVAAGINLDSIVVGTLTFGTGKVNGINVYGQVSGSENIYRINALTGDPNHLGVILCVPLLGLLPVYLADRDGRRRLGLLLAFLFAVQVLTLSRSAALGDVVGLAVLLPFIHGVLPRARTMALSFAGVAAAFLALYTTSHFVRTVVDARTQTGGTGTDVHLGFYQLVPPALDPNPVFGMGFNTFADFYQYVTGRADFGPHSFWIATLVETGMAGLCVYLVYFAYLMLSALALSRSAVPYASQLGGGLVAALAGTAAANFFYLTMHFPYFFVVAVIVVAGVALYVPARQRAPQRGAPAPASTLAA